MRRNSIHVWVPGIQDGVGGIQAFSRVYVQALAEAFPSLEIHVFVKNDLPVLADPLRLKGVKFYSMVHYPKWSRTLSMVGFGLAVGFWKRPRCVITTHLHFLPALHMLRWLCGIPVMSVLHGIEAWNLRSGLRLRAMRAADHLMAVSHHTRNEVSGSCGVAPERISVVPNTFDAARFTIGPKPAYLLMRYGLTPKQPVIMTVSRLAVSERYKGHRQILQGLHNVRNQFPGLRYLVVGSGDDMPRLRTIVQNSDLEDCVIFAGHVPAEELPDHYKLCDVFAMPSCKEGFGIVFLEAMASGKPVVAGNLDGSVDALDQGRLGILVDPHDSMNIAENICKALGRRQPEAVWNSPELLRNAVISQFGYERVRPMLAKVVDQLMGHSSFSAGTDVVSGGQHELNTLPHVVILTQLTSPCQVDYFNALAAANEFHLEAIYLTSRDQKRQRDEFGISHDHLMLSESPGMRSVALEAVRRADLVVFNGGADRFALRAIRERVRMQRPWVFWGDIPHAFQSGIWGVLARRVLLRMLHRNAVAIWAASDFGNEAFRREFGGGRRYCTLPYVSNLRPDADFQRMQKEARLAVASCSLDQGVKCFTASVKEVLQHLPSHAFHAQPSSQE